MGEFSSVPVPAVQARLDMIYLKDNLFIPFFKSKINPKQTFLKSFAKSQIL